MSDELALAIWQSVSNQYIANPVKFLMDYPVYMLTNIWDLPVNFGKTLVNSLRIAATEADKSVWGKTWLNETLNFIFHKVWLWKTIDKMYALWTWKWVYQTIVDKYNLADRTKETRSWENNAFVIDNNDKLFKILSALWTNRDYAVQKYFYDQIDKSNTKLNFENVWPLWQLFIRFIKQQTWQIQRNYEWSFLNPSSYTQTWKYNDNLIDKQYTKDILRITDTKTSDMNELLQKIWISTKITDVIINSKAKNLKSIRSNNDVVEKIIWERMLTYWIPKKNVTQYLHDLQKINPAWYNNFIAWLAKTKRFIDENPEIDLNNPWTTSKISNFFKWSTWPIDSTIANHTETKSLSTSYTNTLFRELGQLDNNILKEWWIEEAKKRLGMLEQISSEIVKSWSYTEWMTDAIKLKSLELQKLLANIKDKWYKWFSKDYPTLHSLIIWWLTLRGEWPINKKDNINTPPVSQDSKQSTSNLIPNQIDLKWLILPTKKQKTKPLPQLRVPKVKVEPLFKNVQAQPLSSLKQILLSQKN